MASVQETRHTNGAALAAIIIGTIVLLPLCGVGLLLLLFLPAAESRSIIVTYHLGEPAQAPIPSGMGQQMASSRQDAAGSPTLSAADDPLSRAATRLAGMLGELATILDGTVAKLVPARSARLAVYAAITLLALVIMCVDLQALAIRGQQAQQIQHAPLATATIVPTDTEVPAPAAAIIQGAVLGGDLGAFDDAFGVTSSGDAHYASIGGREGMLNLTPQQGIDGLTRAMIITITPPPDQRGSYAWDGATMEAFVHQLLPPDATLVGTEQGPQGPTQDLHSNELAATFPANLFTDDANTHTVPPGTLNWICFLAFDHGASGVDFCNVSVGTYN